jgi:DNA-binding transcriptional ArsR family regulator
MDKGMWMIAYLHISRKSELIGIVNGNQADENARRRRAEVFKALGHRARLRIVDELAGGERCVCDLVAATGLGWSTVSRHLTVLRSAGVISDDKRGVQVFYRLSLPCVAAFSACLDAACRGESVEVRTCCA